ncbi:hypothetical protein M3148_11310 [Georgenia satyanarayanai]|uniref:hypothetical protein n=1 Tax=Georgenia satyanarayanai TaxID=860221 RepID=UPI00203CA379|nr:hypothetical protein [Georgenia satyanarayanai]MCM3661571.1 hypothetical protein [Georgenia satyanarayanai]
MIVDALALLALGALAVLAPASPRFRSHLTRRLATQTGGSVPAQYAPALEARMTRRARAVGSGILLAGAALVILALLWPAGADAPSGGYVVVSLAFVFGAAGLAVVEIARPGTVGDAPRTARATAPTMSDYVPPADRALCWAFAGVGLLVLVITLALGGGRWFDADTLWRSPLPVLAVALPVLTALSELAIRRVLDAPQPSRGRTELYWQDAVRASTLSSLMAPPALVGLLALVVTGAVLDDAASVAAVATGEVGPAWSLWLLVGGYVLPFVLLAVALVVATRRGGSAPQRFRERLWDGQQLGGPAAAGA